jgi:hypothetical protein
VRGGVEGCGAGLWRSTFAGCGIRECARDAHTNALAVNGFDLKTINFTIIYS